MLFTLIKSFSEASVPEVIQAEATPIRIETIHYKIRVII